MRSTGLLMLVQILKTKNMNSNSLQRFLTAQEQAYPNALAEIKSGRKSSHWMWYVFPQLKGLGFSPTSEFYGINGLEEAMEYLQHPILGERLREISSALLELEASDAQQVMGSPDHFKLKSSMTLFASIPDVDPVFKMVLEKFYSGEKDKKTLAMIGKNESE